MTKIETCVFRVELRHWRFCAWHAIIFFPSKSLQVNLLILILWSKATWGGRWGGGACHLKWCSSRGKWGKCVKRGRCLASPLIHISHTHFLWLANVQHYGGFYLKVEGTVGTLAILKKLLSERLLHLKDLTCSCYLDEAFWIRVKPSSRWQEQVQSPPTESSTWRWPGPQRISTDTSPECSEIRDWLLCHCCKQDLVGSELHGGWASSWKTNATPCRQMSCACWSPVRRRWSYFHRQIVVSRFQLCFRALLTTQKAADCEVLTRLPAAQTVSSLQNSCRVLTWRSPCWVALQQRQRDIAGPLKMRAAGGFNQASLTSVAISLV